MTDVLEPYRMTYGKVALDGLHNTRDLGGLPAKAGHVLPRRLLRSGSLASATPGDLDVLRNAYDVRLVIDLRTDEEAARWPDPMDSMPDARLVRLPVFRVPGGADAREAMTALGEKLASGELDVAGLFADLYPRFVLGEDGVAAYRGLFRELLELEEGAALWHCSAGKDRCGMASVLVETALGVPRDLVERDYLATNELIEAKGSARNMFDVGGVDAHYLHAHEHRGMQKAIAVVEEAAQPFALRGVGGAGEAREVGEVACDVAVVFVNPAGPAKADIELGMLSHDLHLALKALGDPEVVAVDAGQPVATHQGKSHVGGAANVLVFGETMQVHARVVHEGLNHGARPVRRAVVHDHKLKVLPCLAEHACYGGAKGVLVVAVNYEHTNKRFVHAALPVCRRAVLCWSP